MSLATRLFTGIFWSALLGAIASAQGKPADAGASDCGRGMAALNRGDLIAARAAFEKAVQASPKIAEGQSMLAQVLVRQGQVEQAIVHQPDMAGAHTTLASVLRQLGDTAGAEAEAKVGGQISQEKTSLQAAAFSTNSGKRLLANGDLDGAISQFRTAIHSVPTYAMAHYQLAVALAQKGQKDESSSEFQKASELDSHLVAPH